MHEIHWCTTKRKKIKWRIYGFLAHQKQNITWKIKSINLFTASKFHIIHARSMPPQVKYLFYIEEEWVQSSFVFQPTHSPYISSYVWSPFLHSYPLNIVFLSIFPCNPNLLIGKVALITSNLQILIPLSHKFPKRS